MFSSADAQDLFDDQDLFAQPQGSFFGDSEGDLFAQNSAPAPTEGEFSAAPSPQDALYASAGPQAPLEESTVATANPGAPLQEESATPASPEGDLFAASGPQAPLEESSPAPASQEAPSDADLFATSGPQDPLEGDLFATTGPQAPLEQGPGVGPEVSQTSSVPAPVPAVPESPEPSPSLSEQDLLNQVENLERGEKWEELHKALQLLLEKNPDHQEAAKTLKTTQRLLERLESSYTKLPGGAAWLTQ